MVATGSVLFTIALLWLAAVVAPGPNFLVTTRTAVARSRAAGMQAALGIAAGAGIWGLAGFFGVHALFAAASWLYIVLKLCGGAYLIVLGARLLLNSLGPQAPATMPLYRRSVGSAFRTGFVTSIANPRTALSTAGLFASTLPQHPSVALGLCAVSIMIGIAAAWYGLLAWVLGTRPVASAFQRLRRWVDRVAGLALMYFGARLALER